MYMFACSGRPHHISYSASKEQHHPECPNCGAPTHLGQTVREMESNGATVLDICVATGISSEGVHALLNEETS
jgi:hypothetical protein